jgi:rhamnogalacturonyl hydrolase YesR
VLSIAVNTVSNKPADSLPLIANQGSAADPASIGVSVLLANWTRPDKTSHVFADAASGQLQHLLTQAPQSVAGAISHREDQVQLWSDFVYMVPPFIAYYGALQGGDAGRSLMQAAYDQCRLYRDALKDDNGLWRHIALGNYQDNTHWATGNGWAAAGMLRVLQTFNHSSQGHRFTQQQANLTQWIGEITDAAWARQQKDGSILNVIDDAASFSDTASTALLASVTYRMAVFNATSAVSKPVVAANKALAYVQANIDLDGWVQNAVDPIAFDVPLKTGEHSPESQAFVLLLHAAYRDWQKYLSTKSKSVIGN